MKTKLNMLLLAALLTSSYAFSPNAAHAQKTKLGITAGTTFSHLTATGSGSQATGSKPGFTLGVLAKVPRFRNIFIQPVFSFKQKSGITKSYYNQYTTEDKYSEGFLDLTLNYVYMPGKDAGFFIGAGPSFSKGIYGERVTQPSQGASYVRKLDLPLLEAQVSANILTGYSFKNGPSISVNYNYDLVTLSIEDTKYSYFGLSLDLMRNQKK